MEVTMSKQTAVEMYSHLYGKEVTMDDRFETKVIWSEELAIKNNGKWIPKEVTMSKQTAVDWLEDYIQKEINKYRMHPMDLHAIHALNHIKEFACSKAKQMEKEQIEMAYKEGNHSEMRGGKVIFEKMESYYNETYGQTKN